MSFGLGGWTLSTTNILRVYWDLSVKPYYVTARPWTALGALGNYVFPQLGGGTINVATGVECWPFWLQWDITSNALANFVDVPGQGDFNSTAGSYKGNALSDCSSTSVVPAFLETAAAPVEGAFNTRYNVGNVNYLVRDDVVSTNARLDYNGGSLQAILMSEG